MTQINRFGNMMPPPEAVAHPYLLDRTPFQIAGNLYFVGNEWCSSHLIDTGAGLILLDVPTASGLPGLLYNIDYLGFHIRDVKYIVISHAHSDHFGCVNALIHRTHAKTFLSAIDSEDMRRNFDRIEMMNRDLGPYNESFIPDVELQDGDRIELGNTSIRCVLTPGHTVGVMSHFWDMDYHGETVHVGIYGGAGFISLSKEALHRNHLPLSLQQAFLDSIDKVWDEPVDLMLGNHPFHNDVYQKYMRRCRGEDDPFLDPTEWHRFLQELKDRFHDFLKMTPAEIQEMYRQSQLTEYYRSCFERP
ncbi:MBL fold metallo-hydrolase [[Clostridium] aminophilum]|uniref:Metallo-beta-lactamase class B n=1 Tax=[Clostridium] aminophilum TaxID=1526 RepID=A0A1I6IBJ7_9FIRM|nr:MBL fold metallo-hydrolase [[Clostridium] aminophilum]SFR64053.1 metallo-beta-lactamase class B [[Clostridium] aminophilum]